jgi:RNA polymerase sigma-70 factor (ECF subfamily)
MDRAVPLGAVMDESSPNSGPDLETLFRRYSRYVAAVALRLTGRDDEIDDVVQEVFLAAWRGISRLRDPEAAKGWLATVTVRIVRRKLWRRRLGAMFGFTDGADYQQLAAAPEDRAFVACVYQLLDAQPVGERLAWTLRHVEGEPLERVAELCGCSLATAKRRIAAVQKRLQTELGHD